MKTSCRNRMLACYTRFVLVTIYVCRSRGSTKRVFSQAVSLLCAIFNIKSVIMRLLCILRLSFVSDFVHNRPQKIKVFFLNKFAFVIRQILSYGGMYFFRTTGLSISKSIWSDTFCRSGIISRAKSLSSCIA